MQEEEERDCNIEGCGLLAGKNEYFCGHHGVTYRQIRELEWKAAQAIELLKYLGTCLELGFERVQLPDPKKITDDNVFYMGFDPQVVYRQEEKEEG